MFKKLIGIFDRVRAAPAPTSEALLRDGLQGLIKLDADLRERALAYVVTGAPEAVLLELRRFDGGAGLLLGRPGKLGARLAAGGLSDDEYLAAKASLCARDAFYQHLGSTQASAILLRLGKLFEAADQGRSLDRRCNAAPDSLLYLLNDALSTSVDSDVSDPSEHRRPAWDVSLIGHLLVGQDLPASLALQLVFERNGVDIHHPDRSLDRLLAPGPLTDYMLAHGESVEQLPALLSPCGRLLLADRIGSVAALTGRFAQTLVLLATDTNKTVRDTAARHLDGIAEAHRIAQLAQLLATGSGAQRALAAQLLGRTLGADSAACLAAALEHERSRPVRQAIEGALSRLGAAGEAGSLALPPAPEWEAVPDVPLGEDAFALVAGNRLELIERHRLAAQAEQEQDPLGTLSGRRRQKHYEHYLALTDAQLAGAVRALNRHADLADQHQLEHPLVNETLNLDNRLASLPGFGVTQLLRWIRGAGQPKGNFWYDARFQAWLARQGGADLDLRVLDEALKRVGDRHDAVAVSCLHPSRSAYPAPLAVLAPASVWPYFSEHPALIDEGLGLCASQRESRDAFDVGLTLDALAAFPALSARWLPKLMELALGEGRAHRTAARKVLGAVPEIGKRVLESLGSSHQETRGAAARWLGEINYLQAVPDLYRALHKETRETVQAAMLTALEELGEDIAPLLAPETLLASARKGLKARLPGTLAWFPLDALPDCRWRNGEPVEPDIIRWWVVLACKLKEPAGNALSMRYLTLLDAESRGALGTLVLHQFIGHDTRVGERPGDYLGSAIGEKGLLALMHGAPADDIVEHVRSYLRDHFARRAQVEALLEAAAGAPDQRVINFLLELSLQYRTVYIREKARALVEQIARRKAWTEDQLADRTVSHAHLDAQGRFELRLGGRNFYMCLGANLKPALHDADHRLVKILTEMDGEDAATVKAARHQFSICNRELRRVVTDQTARLHQAMCAGRRWPVAEWRDYLQSHPVVGRLVQGLLWMEMAPDGRCVQLLRPAIDGKLLDADGQPIAVDEANLLQLARRDLLTSKQARAWKNHFKDHAQASLLRQMMRERAAQ